MIYNSEHDVFPSYDDEAYWEYLMKEAKCYAEQGDYKVSPLHDMPTINYEEVARKND